MGLIFPGVTQKAVIIAVFLIVVSIEPKVFSNLIKKYIKVRKIFEKKFNLNITMILNINFIMITLKIVDIHT